MTSFDVIGEGKGTVNEMLMSLPGIYGLAEQDGPDDAKV